MYWKAIDMVEGREVLLALKVAGYPNIAKKRDAEAVFREFHKMAFPYGYENVPVATLGDVFG
jgi:hypothetical protein